MRDVAWGLNWPIHRCNRLSSQHRPARARLCRWRVPHPVSPFVLLRWPGGTSVAVARRKVTIRVRVPSDVRRLRWPNARRGRPAKFQRHGAMHGTACPCLPPRSCPARPEIAAQATSLPTQRRPNTSASAPTPPRPPRRSIVEHVHAAGEQKDRNFKPLIGSWVTKTEVRGSPGRVELQGVRE